MKNFNNDIINSIKILKDGGIILYPTDTIWGIGCDATNTAAIKKIYALKKREEKKSMIILLSDKSDINKYVTDPSIKLIDFISNQQRPTTAIFYNANNISRRLINADGSIAIRITKDDFCKTIIKQLNKPLVSTSANISGDIAPGNFGVIGNEIKNGVDYIVQHRQDEMEIHQSSSIIKLNSNNEIEKIR